MIFQRFEIIAGILALNVANSEILRGMRVTINGLMSGHTVSRSVLGIATWRWCLGTAQMGNEVQVKTVVEEVATNMAY